jgi:hypothetical protein
MFVLGFVWEDFISIISTSSFQLHCKFQQIVEVSSRSVWLTHEHQLL